MKLTAIYMRVPEGYVAFIEELPGANTQGATIEEAREKRSSWCWKRTERWLNSRWKAPR
jgi:predicted RNase H-like HicB family nuclease